MTRLYQAILTTTAFRSFAFMAAAFLSFTIFCLSAPAARAVSMDYPSLFSVTDSQNVQAADACGNLTMDECRACELKRDPQACDTCFRAAAQACANGCFMVDWPQQDGTIIPKPCNAIPGAANDNANTGNSPSKL